MRAIPPYFLLFVLTITGSIAAPRATDAESPKRVVTCSSIWNNATGQAHLFDHWLNEFYYVYPEAEIVICPDDGNEAQMISQMIQTGIIFRDIVRIDTGIYQAVSKILNDPDWGRKYLHDFLQEPNFIRLYRPKLVEWTQNRGRIGGIWPGPYLETKYACIWYNARLGEKIGFKPSSMQLSTDELLSAAQKLQAYNQTSAQKIGLFSMTKVGRSTYRLLRRLYTSALADPQGNLPPMNQAPRESSLYETLQYFEKLSAFNVHFKSNTYREDIDLFMNNEVLFYPSYTQDYFTLLEANGPTWMKEILLLESPHLKPTHFAFGEFEHSWAVMKNSPNRDLAVAFLKSIPKAQAQAESLEGSMLQSGLRGSFFSTENEGGPYEKYLRYMITKYQDNMYESFVESKRYWPQKKQPYHMPTIQPLLYDILLHGRTADQTYTTIMTDQ